MGIVILENGEITSGWEIAESRWNFIEEYLDGYSLDRQVTLSNDIAVVLDVITSGFDPYEYISHPENERDYSDAPFDNVAMYVDDLRDVEALEDLLEEVDSELFQRAIDDYRKDMAEDD